MTDRKLQSADLGEVGEALFAGLCAQGQLVCNGSTRDLTGWDFIVEFPLPSGDDELLDKRMPGACHVQLKSTNGRNGSRVSLRLSAVERLAKDPRPALVVVFRLTTVGHPVAGYLIHLLDDQLAKVLKRLRSAHAERQYDVNHSTISFDYTRVGSRFPLTAEGLRSALLNACGQDPHAYTFEKKRQLEELGYEGGGLEAEALIRIDGPEHLRKIVLGLSSIAPERLEVFDRRFDIRIPYKGALFDDITELTLDPPHIGSCEISIRGSALSRAAIFKAETFIGPPIPELGGPSLLMRHADFILTINSESANFETVGHIDEIARPLSRWVEMFRALTYLASGHASITVTHLKTFPPVKLKLDQSLDGPYIQKLPQLLAFLEGWERLLALAGITSQEAFKMDDIWAAADVGFAVDLMTNPEPTVRLEFQNFDLDVDSDVMGLYFNSCRLADAGITYCAKVRLRKHDDNEWPYRSESFLPIDVRPEVEDLNSYGLEHAEVTNVSVLLDPKKITKRI